MTPARLRLRPLSGLVEWQQRQLQRASRRSTDRARPVSRLACLGHRDDARRIATDPVAGGGSAKNLFGQGLVPDAVAASPASFGGGLGSRADGQRRQSLGPPVSTTAQPDRGADWGGLASGSGVNLAVLARASSAAHRCPLLAIAITAVLILRPASARRRLGITRDSYIRIEEDLVLVNVDRRAGRCVEERVRLAIAGAQPIDRYAGTPGGFRRSVR